MKRFFALGLIFISFSIASQAFAEDDDDESSYATGTYLGLMAGATFPADANSDYQDGTRLLNSFDSGYFGGVALGYRFNKCWRGEAEFSYRNSNIDEVKNRTTGATTTASGSLKGWSFMGNLIYTLKTDWKLSPYAGVGIGFTRYDYDNGTVGFTKVSSSDELLCFQGIVGLSLDLSERTELFGEYRYFRTGNDGKFSDDANVDFEAEFYEHMATFGLRWAF